MRSQRYQANIVAALTMLGLWFAVGSVGALQTDDLTVVWGDADTLYLWQATNPTPSPLLAQRTIGASIAPTGAAVAALTGAGGVADTLWYLTPATQAVLVTSDGMLNGASIGQVAWADAVTLYFNTTRFEAPFGAIPQNDLWRVDVTTGATTQQREPGTGGAFNISPDGRYLTLITPGRFDQNDTPAADGVIHLYDTRTDTASIVLGYQPVASGTPQPFYPVTAWTPDSSAFLVGIPPPDLLYTPGDTLLWRVPVGEEAALRVGAIRAGFYGQPRWNADRSVLLYATPNPNDDAQTLVYAASDGANPQTIGVVGPRPLYQWAQKGQLFLWQPDERIAVGSADFPTRYRLDDTPRHAIWAGDGRLVYTTGPGDDLLVLSQTSDNIFSMTPIDPFPADGWLLDAQIVSNQETTP
jgi:hypothetical protein